MWKRNPDGGGIAWIEDGKIQVYKTMKLKDFKQKFKEITSKYGDSDILVHMRIATHGSVCIDNNHPFHVDTQTVFAHNGIMPHEFHPPAKSDLSDTRYFNQVFLQNMKPIALDDELFRTAIGDIIGMGNKLVILSANKKLKQDSYIINEHLGQAKGDEAGFTSEKMAKKVIDGVDELFATWKPREKYSFVKDTDYKKRVLPHKLIY